MSATVANSLNKGDTVSWEKPVASVSIATGKVLLSDGDEHTFVGKDDQYAADGSTSVSLYALEATNYAVNFVADTTVANPIPEQSVDFSSALTLKELQQLARERGEHGYSNLSKADLIARLRNG